MKSTIIFLGLAALSFTSANAANAFKSQDLDQQEGATLTVEITNQQNQLVFVNQETSNNTEENNTVEAVIFDPKSVVAITYVKTIEEVIAENKSITESREEVYQPLLLTATVQDKISEGNQIIESTVSGEEYPLDFEKINSKVKTVKVYNNAIAVDLKL